MIDKNESAHRENEIKELIMLFSSLPDDKRKVILETAKRMSEM